MKISIPLRKFFLHRIEKICKKLKVIAIIDGDKQRIVFQKEEKF